MHQDSNHVYVCFFSHLKLLLSNKRQTLIDTSIYFAINRIFIGSKV